MLFGYHTFDKSFEDHLREIAALANDEKALIFLDTNVLAYLYKLHAAARHEFFVWSDTVVAAKRLAIPSWAASEYLSRVTSKGLDAYTPKSKEPSQITKALDAMHETAALFVDEPLLRKIGIGSGRAGYLSDFKRAIDALGKFMRVFSEQFDPGIIHNEVVHHLSKAILQSDLAELSKQASQNGNARYEHRLPPGFRDGEKELNRFGDLIIWYEILEKSACSVAEFPKVLFVTNDEKLDWVYAPKMRIETVRGVRKVVANSRPEIKLADPRLVSEFQHRTGHSNFEICSLSTLIEALSKINASQFGQLAAAIQIDTGEDTAPQPPTIEEETSSSTDINTDTSAESPEVVTEVARDDALPKDLLPQDTNAPFEELAAPTLHYDLEAMQDAHYQLDAPTEINDVIRDLKSHNWYAQNPAMTKIRFFREAEFPTSSWFVLGRNIYQAATGNSQKAMEFISSIENQLKQFPQMTANHLLAGMIFEVYFDSFGAFRKNAKFAHADKLLAVVALAEYVLVLDFILFHLKDHLRRLKFLPGSREQKILHIVSTAVDCTDTNASPGNMYALQSVTLDGTDLLIHLADDDEVDTWTHSSPGSTLSIQSLRDKVCEDLAIPKWALTTQFDPSVRPDARFVVPDWRAFYPKVAL
jgi:hypothetical protein